MAAIELQKGLTIDSAEGWKLLTDLVLWPRDGGNIDSRGLETAEGSCCLATEGTRLLPAD